MPAIEYTPSQIDRSNQMLVTLPVSGESVWVDKPDDYVDEVAVARAAMPQVRGAIAGQNSCQHCGQGFNSSNVLRDHVLRAHPIASGQADMGLVEMPGGQMIPAGAVPEIVADKKNAEITRLKARETQLSTKLEELAAKLVFYEREEINGPNTASK